mgnify:CR=1 FL=1
MTSRDTATGGFRPTEATLAALASVRTLVVPTDADDAGYERAREAALDLVGARPLGERPVVVLHDRSDERWTDTPHPEGPFRPDQVEADRRPHLPGQMQPFSDAGLDVRAWYASIPALTAVITTVQTLDADAVMVPAEPESPKMMDRLQAGDDAGDQIGRVLDQQLERTVFVFVVHDDGTIETLATVDRTDRPI